MNIRQRLHNLQRDLGPRAAVLAELNSRPLEVLRAEVILGLPLAFDTPPEILARADLWITQIIDTPKSERGPVFEEFAEWINQNKGVYGESEHAYISWRAQRLVANGCPPDMP